MDLKFKYSDIIFNENIDNVMFDDFFVLENVILKFLI